MNSALADIRILDLSRVLAGPYCTQLLADFGADVIKIEQPGAGDGTRGWGPPWAGDQSAYFLSANRNKRSLTLNLKSTAGRDVLRKLALKSDVLIENFKVGTTQKLGIDYATLAELNSRLIYCAISGYGQNGPSRDLPGYDFIIQAQGGIMSITGPADGEPHKVGVAIADITAGLFAANAILTALHARHLTGKGQFIDVALFDAQLAWLANVAHNYFATGETPARYGNAHANIVPYQTFQTQDGYIALGVGTDAQFKRLCAAGDRLDLWRDERFQTNKGRVVHREELIVQLAPMFRGRETAVWLNLCRQNNIPAGPINDIATALSDPQVRSRDMVQTINHPTAGEIQLLGPVAKLSETPAVIRSAPPVLGADTDEILRTDLGLDKAAIAHLREAGVV